MSFMLPWALLLLLPLALLALREARVRRLSPALVVADLAPWAAAARPSWRIRLRWLPLLLRVLAIALVIIAFARPRQGLTVTTIPEEGIDIVIAFDASSSMTSPVTGGGRTSRLEAAQSVLTKFVDSLEGDRVGLVIFQARALTLSPLTGDLSAIRARVGTIAPGMLNDGTAIGLGLSEALTVIKDSPAKSRVVVLLTDGENNSGNIPPLQAARVAQALGIRVYTIGFLGPGGGVDRRMLTSMAETTGGRTFDARTEAELQSAYDEIANLERSKLAERRFTTFREFAPWVAATAAALLAVDLLLRATWLRTNP